MKTRNTPWMALLALLLACSTARAVVIDSYAWYFPVVSNINGADDLTLELQQEIQAILDAGNLAPLYVSHADQQSVGYTLYNEPGRTITTLAWAYPYLTAAQQLAVKTYVQNQLNDASHAPWATYPLPHSAGAQREPHQKAKWWYERTTFGNRPSVQTIYGLWLYGWRTGDWASIQAKWTTIKSMYSSRAAQGDIYGTMCAHIAMARLADKFSDAAQRTTALNNLQTQLDAGVNFSAVEVNTQTHYNDPNMYDARSNGSSHRGYMFLDLSPEMGRYLKDNVLSDTLARNDQGKSRFPYWWLLDATYFQRQVTGDEGSGLCADTRGMIFPIERWVVGAPAATLRSYMKSGPNGIGDCYWIEALVQAIEAYGQITWTDVRVGVPTKPGDPTNLVATAVSINQINLSWADNSANEDGFKIERKAGLGGTYAEIASNVVASTYQDTSLAPSTTYYYRVRAFNSVGNSNYTNEANDTTPNVGSPNAPSNLVATVISSTQVNLAWTDNSSNETGFKVERKTGAGGVYAEIAPNVPSNSYQNTGLTSGTTYYYRVRAFNAAGNSPYSNEAGATPAPFGLVFNGTSSRGTAGDSASLDINGNAITMEAWVYLNGPSLFTTQRAVGRQVISTNNNFTRWHGISGASNGQQWNFGLVIGTTYFQAQAGSTLPKNTWVHLAGSYDGANVRFFINGTLAATTPATGNITVNNNSWNVGASASGEYLQGMMDEVRISNIARYTASFAAPTAPFVNDANTKALWHMDENTGNSTADSSGNNNTLSLSNTTWGIGKFGPVAPIPLPGALPGGGRSRPAPR